MINKRCRSYCLSRARWTLYKAKGRNKSFFDGVDLVVIELRLTRYWKLFRYLILKELFWRVIAENLVEDVLRDRLLIFEEYFQSVFHPIIWDWFPDEFDCELGVRLRRRLLCVFKLQTYLLCRCYFDYVSAWLPLVVSLSAFNLELIPGNKTYIVSFVREHEVCQSLFPTWLFPSYLDIPLSLAFFELFVVIRFKFDQRLKNLSVLLWIFVSRKNLLVLLLDLVFLNVCYFCFRFFFPDLFQLVYLPRLYRSALSVL